MLNMAVAQYLCFGDKIAYYFVGVNNMTGGLTCTAYTFVLAIPAYLIAQAPINQLVRNMYEKSPNPEFLETTTAEMRTNSEMLDSWKINKSASTSPMNSPRPSELKAFRN